MDATQLSLIVAVASNRAIGRKGDLPWRLSADLQRFKKLTMGHHIVMGRRTFESIGRLLPGRTTVIVTRQPHYVVEGALVVNSLPAAIAAAAGDPELFVIGGGEIYRQALPLAHRLYLTRVDADVDGDAFFPEMAADEWTEVFRSEHPADSQNEYRHSFHILDRSSDAQ